LERRLESLEKSPPLVHAVKEFLNSEEGKQVTSQAKALKEALGSADSKLRALVPEIEWISLYHAFEMLPMPSGRFEGLFTLMSSFQASGLAIIWLLLRYKNLWNMPTLIIASLVFCLATYSSWLSFKYNRFLGNFNSAQVAAMLEEINKRDHQRTEPQV
jgi:hypothetical protein